MRLGNLNRIDGFHQRQFPVCAIVLWEETRWRICGVSLYYFLQLLGNLKVKSFLMKGNYMSHEAEWSDEFSINLAEKITSSSLLTIWTREFHLFYLTLALFHTKDIKNIWGATTSSCGPLIANRVRNFLLLITGFCRRCDLALCKMHGPRCHGWGNQTLALSPARSVTSWLSQSQGYK